MVTGVDPRKSGHPCPSPYRYLFRDNYFTLGGRPLFLFGSDSYSETYIASCENPLAWSDELESARDFGVQLYENLQYALTTRWPMPTGGRSRPSTSRSSALAWCSCQGCWSGTTWPSATIAWCGRASLCEDYARRLATSPALLWYLNGDYVLDTARHPTAVRVLWNRWLALVYRDRNQWAETWRSAAAGQNWGDLNFPPPDSGRWDDVAAVDRATFLEVADEALEYRSRGCLAT